MQSTTNCRGQRCLNVGSKASRATSLVLLVIAGLYAVTFAFLKPWTLVAQEAFFWGQVSSLVALVAVQGLHICRTGYLSSPLAANSAFYLLTALFYGFAICGLIHPDASFEQEVKDNVRQAKSPMTAFMMFTVVTGTFFVFLKSICLLSRQLPSRVRPAEITVHLTISSVRNAHDLENQTPLGKKAPSSILDQCHVVLSKEGEAIPADSTCVICLSELTQEGAGQQQLAQLPTCRHYFHAECLKGWTQTSCPLCRKVAQPKTEEITSAKAPCENAIEGQGEVAAER